MTDAIREFYKNAFAKKVYWVWTIICVIIAYGFSINNRTISIDGLSYDRYYLLPKSTSGLIAGKRWGFYLYSFLFASKNATSNISTG